jgi:homogentisate 1,2-dioxygenase
MAFMFETKFPQRLTKYAAHLEERQEDYIDCWRGLRKHFNPSRNTP